MEEIIRQAYLFKKNIRNLRKLSPNYPIIYETSKDGVYWLSTMVSFESNGKNYKRHHVESGILKGTATKECVLNRLNRACEMTICCGLPSPFDEEKI